MHLGFIRGSAECGNDVAGASTLVDCLAGWRACRDSALAAHVSRASTCDGFIVTDRFHQLVGSIAEFDRAASPPELLADARGDVCGADPDGAGAGVDANRRCVDPRGVSASGATACTAVRCATCRRRCTPRLTALRYEGLDTVGHYYLRYTSRGRFAMFPKRSGADSRRSSTGTTPSSTARSGASLDALAPEIFC